MMKERQEPIAEMAIDDLNEPTPPGCPGRDPAEAVAFSILRLVETPEDTDTDFPQTDAVVGYGRDRTLHDAQDTPGEWWDLFPPVEGLRFRIFYPEDQELPEPVKDLMAAVGATPVGIWDDNAGSYESRGKEAAHYVLPDKAPFVMMVAGEAM